MAIVINIHEELILKNFIRSYVNVLDEINGITVTSPTRFKEAGNINYVHQIGSYFDLHFSDRLSSCSPLPSFVVCTSFNLVLHIFPLLSVDQSLFFSLLFYLIHIYYLYLPYLAIFVDFLCMFKFTIQLVIFIFLFKCQMRAFLLVFKLFFLDFYILRKQKTLRCSNVFRRFKNATLGAD